MKALILGATGLVGQSLLGQLLQDNHYEEIIVFVRRKIDLEHDKLHQVIINYEELDNFIEHFKVDHLFCCLGTTIKVAKTKEAFRKVDFEYPLAAAKLGKSLGIKHFLLVSALGADSKSSVFYNKTKGEVEEAIKNIEIPTFTYLRPSILLGERSESRIGESIGAGIGKLISPLMFGALKKYRPIEASEVAQNLILAALEQESTSAIERHTVKV